MAEPTQRNKRAGRGCPRKFTRSKPSVFTIFPCLTSCTISLNLNDHWRRGNVFHTTEIQEKQTDVKRILNSEIRGHNLGREAPWMPVDPIRPPSLEMDSSAATGEGRRAHRPEDRPRQESFSIHIGFLLTSQMPLLCFYTNWG